MKTKRINKLSSGHHGVMPIRVLQHSLTYSFENTSPGFLELIRKVVVELGLEKGIRYDFDEDKVKSPFVNFNKIFIQEAFLSYVWCITFALEVFHEEITIKRHRNYQFGNEAEKTNVKFASDAYALWDYACSLINEYKEWDINLPNPEIFDLEYQELIPQINSLYLTAMNYVLAHEFAHIELEHNSRDDHGLDPNQLNIIIEKEADDRAIRLVLEGITPDSKETIEVGILLGLCSLLFFKSSTRERKYPDVDERIDSYMKKINPPPNDGLWGIASLAYKLWDKKFSKNLIWEEGLESLEAIYYSIKKQVENI